MGLVAQSPRTGVAFVPFFQRLQELGYVEGQNLSVDFIPLAGRNDGYESAMKELVARKADILVAWGPEAALKAALSASASLPVVMLAIDYDPLALGHIRSLARPGTNVTGIFLQQIDLAVKRLDLLRQMFPTLTSAAMFWDSPSESQWTATQSAARTYGLDLVGIELRETPYDYEAAWSRVPPTHRRALIVPNSPVLFFERARLAAFTLDRRIASIYAWREWVIDGGLASYGPSFAEISRRMAVYVDRIARGAKPGELPIEQPSRLELVINLKTARVLGLDIPASVLGRVDESIE